MSILGFFGLKKAVYFPGCVTDFLLKDIKDNYKSILSDLKIDYESNPPFQCCGAPLLNSGHEKEFLELVKKNKALLQKQGYAKIIVNCPHCYYFFKKYYGLPVEHMSEILNRSKAKITHNRQGDVSYFDACYLGKKSNIFDEPRNAIRAAGYLIRELKTNKECASCCGVGGLLKAANPTLANTLAKKLLNQFITKEVIVPCPLCYLHLKENTKEMKITELSEVFVEI